MTPRLVRAVNRKGLKAIGRIAEWIVLHLGSGPVSCMIKYRALVAAGARVERPLSIDSNVWIRQPQNLTAGPGLVISRGSVLNCSTELTMGRDCLVGYGAFIGTAAHRVPERLDEPVASAGHDHRPVVLGDGVWIGAHACVLPGVELPLGCVVGAGAVVTNSAEPGSVLVGVPARVSRRRASDGGPGTASEAPVV